MRKSMIPILSVIAFAFNSCTTQQLQQTADAAVKAAADAMKTTGQTTTPLTNEEVINGLREALTVGTNNSSGLASKLDGFYKNPAIFIPFPSEAQKVKEWAVNFGLGTKVDAFEMNLNRAAEEAAKGAAPVFIDAIKGMTISDGFAILKGTDNAATQFLKDKTSVQLKEKFRPVVQDALTKVQITRYWNPIITAYNRVPLVQQMNPDLEAYVTDKAMIGLFKLIEDEELKIRKDPVARVTDILKRVFGSVTN